MRLSDPFARFTKAEDGATTSDYALLAAGVIGLTLSVVQAVSSGAVDLRRDVETVMATSATVLRNAFDAGQSCPVAGAPSNTMSWTDPLSCPREGGACTPPVLHVMAGYRMSTGDDWTMRFTRVEGEEPIILWYDHTGALVDPPCFE